MKLSLCIAAFNEQNFIHYPLDSAYNLVDEVILVDGGSEDKTVEIARAYGKKVKVIASSNPKMFHINKQKALDAASGEWIIQLDADEELSEELKKEIKQITQGKGESVKGKDTSPLTLTPKAPNAYWIPRKNFFLSRFLMKGGQYPDYTIRFYKNGAVHFPCKSVHENVEITQGKGESDRGKYTSPLTLNPKPNIGYLKNPILHYADPNFSRYLMRWNRYTTMDANQLIEKNQKFGFVNYFFFKPTAWFLRSYIRYRGFQDGFPGFVFALFSSIRFWAIYVKAWQLRREKSPIKPLF